MSLSVGRHRSGLVRARRRDGDRLVGLAGWLFADMLLALAVIFLVVQQPAGEKTISKSSGKRPTVQIVETMDRPMRRNGIDRQWNSSDGEIVLLLRFSEDVDGLEQPMAGDSNGDIVFRGEAAGSWYVADLEGATGSKREFVLKINAPEGYEAGKVAVIVSKGAAFSDGNPNVESEPFEFNVSLRPEKQIDTEQGVFINFVRSRSCAANPYAATENIVDKLLIADSFKIGNPQSSESQRQLVSEGLVSWVRRKFSSNARVGFLIMYARDRGTALEWKACVLRALSDPGLGYVDPTKAEIPVKVLKDEVLPDNDVRLEMYFFNAGSD